MDLTRGSTSLLTSGHDRNDTPVWSPDGLFFRGPTCDNPGPISPDGRWLAYTSEETGRFELFVQSFPTPGRRVQVSQQGAISAWWTGDGRQLLFLGLDLRSLWRVDVDPGPSFGVGAPRQIATFPRAS